jgi:thiol-disulfide isomerase/thioredoxin
MNAKARVVPPGGGAVTMDAAKYQEIVDYLLNASKTAKDNTAAQFAAVKLADQFNPLYPFDLSIAKDILALVPANSEMWALSPHSPSALSRITNSTTYADELIATNPSQIVRAMVLSGRLAEAYQAKDEKKARELYSLLKTEYSAVNEVRYALMQYNPDASVQVGRKVPAFELELLDNGTTISNSSLLGKYYLIDFWATWCGPCVREMPAIHKAYERFKGRKGFEILSISMDGSVAQVAPFRKKWPMPWMNAFIPGVFDAELAQRFEVAGIPKPVLVDATGSIVAMQEELRGESLEKTLEKFLGGEN